jgi:FkbM family methyltransferase
VKGFIKSLARRFGYEVLGPPRAFASQQSLIGLLRQEKINLVLDVGANTGQFADELRTCGYIGRIISFEPIAATHSQLCARAEKDPDWTIAACCAVGATNGSVTMHVSGNSVSSSILEMLPNHMEAAPLSTYERTETVPLNRLDDICATLSTDRILLKIDVQGYERQVLEGAPRVLAGCRAIISEMSLLPLYEGQPLAADMWNLLEMLGFEAWSLEPVFRNPKTGRLLQFDGLFVRQE